MRKGLLLRIGFWLPISISYIIILTSGVFYKAVLIENILAFVLIYLISNSFRRPFIRLTLELAGLYFFNLFLFIEFVHIYLYGYGITQSSFFILFETNKHESGEYLATYFEPLLQLFLGIQILAVSISTYLLIEDYRKIKNDTAPPKAMSFLKYKIRYPVLVILLLLCFFPIRSKILDYFLPYSISKAYFDYKKELIAYEKMGFDKSGSNFLEVTHIESTDPEVYVIVIGESTTKNHMGLYGYYRNTNPRLAAMKDDLVVYNEVISPHTNTIMSLNKVLTLSTYQNPENKFTGTLMQLFNKADFTTYWISNQHPAGLFDTGVTLLSKSCDEQYFLNAGLKYDEVVLEKLKVVLNKPDHKKLIVIHLMGTHTRYASRYPSEFEKFESEPRTKFRHQKAFEVINSYDNAVLYNDFIISEILNQVTGINANSFLLYFSDHGEDVYQTRNISDHNEENATKPMFDIPFILWFSEKFNPNPDYFVFDPDRKFMIESMVHTVADLARINFREFNPKRSLVNKEYDPPTRIILKDKDYDTYFKEK